MSDNPNRPDRPDLPDPPNRPDPPAPPAQAKPEAKPDKRPPVSYDRERKMFISEGEPAQIPVQPPFSPDEIDPRLWVFRRAMVCQHPDLAGSYVLEDGRLEGCEPSKEPAAELDRRVRAGMPLDQVRDSE